MFDKVLRLFKGCVLVFTICFYCFLMTVGLCIIYPLKYLGFKDFVFRLSHSWGGRGYWTFIYVLEKIAGVELVWYGDDIPKYENAICISNHVSDTDFVLVQTFGMRKGMLGHTKFMMKKAVSFVPGIGWGCALLSHILMSRDWLKDKVSIEKTFQNVKENKYPVWIISFLEGTRITPKKLEECQEFAKKKNIKPTNYVLTPRVKGFKATVRSFANSQVHYVYDFTFGYEVGPISLWQLMRYSFAGRKIHIDVQRIAIKDIPFDNDVELEKWVYDRYYRKDEMLAKFSKLPDNEKHFETPLRNVPYNYEDFITEPIKRMNKHD
ncbi:hypothetical protein ABK040_008597 [Willaertia magna]